MDHFVFKLQKYNYACYKNETFVHVILVFISKRIFIINYSDIENFKIILIYICERQSKSMISSFTVQTVVAKFIIKFIYLCIVILDQGLEQVYIHTERHKTLWRGAGLRD